MRKSIVIAGKRIKLEGNTASTMIKGLGVVSIQVDQFVSLAEFLKMGRTAEEIKKSYGLNSTVAAKRLVREAQQAGVKISKYTSEEPRGVGRQPNVYQLTEFVTVAKPSKPEVTKVAMPPAHETPDEAREIDKSILEALKGITQNLGNLAMRVGAIEGRTVVLPRGTSIPHPPASNGHPR